MGIFLVLIVTRWTYLALNRGSGAALTESIFLAVTVIKMDLAGFWDWGITMLSMTSL
jgi:hypothetical protein